RRDGELRRREHDRRRGRRRYRQPRLEDPAGEPARPVVRPGPLRHPRRRHRFLHSDPWRLPEQAHPHGERRRRLRPERLRLRHVRALQHPRGVDRRERSPVGTDHRRPARELWTKALEGYKVDQQEWGITMKSESDPLVYFEGVPEGKTVKNRLHLNLQAADRPSEVSRLVALGATEIEEMSPGGSYVWTNMKDVEGNEFCVSQA